MTMNLPDPVPLGVAGLVTIPRSQLPSDAATSSVVLLDDPDRVDYIADRLNDALGRPLIASGFEVAAVTILRLFDGAPVLSMFAKKALETLRDDTQHSTLAVSPSAPCVGVAFIAWGGSAREVQAQRYGNYLSPLLLVPQKLVQTGIPLAGFLQIDAFVREHPDPNAPTTPLDELFAIDIEYSYLPGEIAGGPGDDTGILPKVLLVNLSLCTEEEAQVLTRFTDAAS